MAETGELSLAVKVEENIELLQEAVDTISKQTEKLSQDGEQTVLKLVQPLQKLTALIVDTKQKFQKGEVSEVQTPKIQQAILALKVKVDDVTNVVPEPKSLEIMSKNLEVLVSETSIVGESEKPSNQLQAVKEAATILNNEIKELKLKVVENPSMAERGELSLAVKAEENIELLQEAVDTISKQTEKLSQGGEQTVMKLVEPLQKLTALVMETKEKLQKGYEFEVQTPKIQKAIVALKEQIDHVENIVPALNLLEVISNRLEALVPEISIIVDNEQPSSQFKAVSEAATTLKNEIKELKVNIEKIPLTLERGSLSFAVKVETNIELLQEAIDAISNQTKKLSQDGKQSVEKLVKPLEKLTTLVVKIKGKLKKGHVSEVQTPTVRQAILALKRQIDSVAKIIPDQKVLEAISKNLELLGNPLAETSQLTEVSGSEAPTVFKNEIEEELKSNIVDIPQKGNLTKTMDDEVRGDIDIIQGVLDTISKQSENLSEEEKIYVKKLASPLEELTALVVESKEHLLRGEVYDVQKPKLHQAVLSLKQQIVKVANVIPQQEPLEIIWRALESLVAESYISMSSTQFGVHEEPHTKSFESVIESINAFLTQAEIPLKPIETVLKIREPLKLLKHAISEIITKEIVKLTKKGRETLNMFKESIQALTDVLSHIALNKTEPEANHTQTSKISTALSLIAEAVKTFQNVLPNEKALVSLSEPIQILSKTIGDIQKELREQEKSCRNDLRTIKNLKLPTNQLQEELRIIVRNLAELLSSEYHIDLLLETVFKLSDTLESAEKIILSTHDVSDISTDICDKLEIIIAPMEELLIELVKINSASIKESLLNENKILQRCLLALKTKLNEVSNVKAKGNFVEMFLHCMAEMAHTVDLVLNKQQAKSKQKQKDRITNLKKPFIDILNELRTLENSKLNNKSILILINLKNPMEKIIDILDKIDIQKFDKLFSRIENEMLPCLGQFYKSIESIQLATNTPEILSSELQLHSKVCRCLISILDDKVSDDEVTTSSLAESFSLIKNTLSAFCDECNKDRLDYKSLSNLVASLINFEQVVSKIRHKENDLKSTGEKRILAFKTIQKPIQQLIENLNICKDMGDQTNDFSVEFSNKLLNVADEIASISLILEDILSLENLEKEENAIYCLLKTTQVYLKSILETLSLNEKMEITIQGISIFYKLFGDFVNEYKTISHHEREDVKLLNKIYDEVVNNINILEQNKHPLFEKALEPFKNLKQSLNDALLTILNADEVRDIDQKVVQLIGIDRKLKEFGLAISNVKSDEVLKSRKNSLIEILNSVNNELNTTQSLINKSESLKSTEIEFSNLKTAVENIIERLSKEMPNDKNNKKKRLKSDKKDTPNEKQLGDKISDVENAPKEVEAAEKNVNIKESAEIEKEDVSFTATVLVGEETIIPQDKFQENASKDPVIELEKDSNLEFNGLINSATEKNITKQLLQEQNIKKETTERKSVEQKQNSRDVDSLVSIEADQCVNKHSKASRYETEKGSKNIRDRTRSRHMKIEDSQKTSDFVEGEKENIDKKSVNLADFSKTFNCELVETGIKNHKENNYNFTGKTSFDNIDTTYKPGIYTGPRYFGKKPIFTTTLRDKIVTRNCRIKLTCSVIGEGVIEISWMKNGENIINDANYYMEFNNNVATLEVLNTSLADSGEYTCLASNDNGTASTSGTLKVVESFESKSMPPVFTRPLRDRYKITTDELTLECRIRCQPAPTIKWLKDGEEISLGGRFAQSYSADGICKLSIANPAKSDSGRYTCRAESNNWVDQITHELKFNTKEDFVRQKKEEISLSNVVSQAPKINARRPYFSGVLTDSFVPEGGIMALQVEVKGTPAEVTWFKESQKLSKLSSKHSTFEEKGIHTLIISNVKEYDSGKYTCRASNHYGRIESSSYVQVLYPSTNRDGKPAMFLSRPDKMLNVAAGEDIVVSCRVTGDPKPKVIWMKGLKDITDSMRSLKEVSDDYIRFTLKRATLDDTGTYCILAKNRIGCDRAFFTVRQRERARSLTPGRSESTIGGILEEIPPYRIRQYYRDVPGHIEGEPRITDSGRNWISLSWNKAEQRSVAPILAYRIDMWQKGAEGARWVTLGMTPLNNYDVFNLKPDAEYQFRITPRNRYGWGEGVQTTPFRVGTAVEMPEFITHLPGQIKTLTGSDISLECEIKNQQTLQVKWLKDSMEILPEDNTRYSIGNDGGKCFLRISNVQQTDCGRFTCEASNKAGTISTFLRLSTIEDPKILNADRNLKKDLMDKTKDLPPHFTMRLRDRRVQMTYPVRLTCQVVGCPEPLLKWFKDGEELISDERHTFSNEDNFHTLEIEKTVLNDSGIYSARAANEFGAVICRCVLTVDKGIKAYIAPEFIVPLELNEPRLKQKRELALSARVEAYPSVSLCWYRDGIRLRPSRRHVMSLSHDGRLELIVSGFTAKDAGVYSCVASNIVGQSESNIKAELRSEAELKPGKDVPYSREPKFLKKPLATTAYEGDNIVILCEVTGDPKPEVVWLRDFLKPEYYKDAAHFHLVGDGPEYRLEIPNAKLDFTGTYTVYAKNQHGDAKAIISLQIKVKDPIGLPKTDRNVISNVQTVPEIISDLRDIRCCDGDSVTLECKVKVTPSLDIRWEKDGKLVHVGGDFKTELHNDTARLTIEKVYSEDEGEYSCIAFNQLGSAATFACLVVDLPEEKDTQINAQLIRPPSLFAPGSTTPISTPRTTPNRSVSPRPRRPVDINSDGPRRRARAVLPKFYAVPHDRVAEEGETIRFQCAVIGHPDPWVTWKKGNEIITPSSRIKISENEDLHTLEIQEVTTSDSGVYKVILENDVGRIEASAKLDVIAHRNYSTRGLRARSSSPRITPGYSNYKCIEATARHGTAARLFCDIRATPTPHLRWYKNGTALTKREKYKATFDGQEAALEIFDITDKDAGVYICVAENIYGQAKTAVKLSVAPEIFPPRIVKALPKYMVVPKRRRTILHFKIEGAEPLDVIWLKDGCIISDCEQFTQSYFDGIVSLTFENPLEDDSGRYTCEVYNMYGEISTRCNVTVNKRKTKSKHYRKSINTTTIIDSEKLKGRELKNDERTSITSGNGLSCLLLQNITTDDSGKYDLCVENKFGSDSCFASVSVEGPPDPPSGKPCITTNGDCVIVNWSSSPYDGGRIVTGFQVEYSLYGSDIWTTAIEDCHSLSYVVCGLQPGARYIFRVRAVNIHGISSASLESDIIQLEEHSERSTFEPRIVTLEDGLEFNDRFEILEELGKGRYGVVHKVIDRRTNHKLAAKFIKCRTVKDKDKVQDEIDIMNLLRHPKLLQLAAAFENPKDIIMVMEYISGGELFERVVADDFTLTEKDCILFMRQICEGVAYMHEQHIVHLDLKPENIMCHTRTSHEIKIIDFGLAQKVDPNKPMCVLFGTAEFISPEIINYEPIGIQSDMWSIGVICYVLLSGLSPFMGDTDSETFANITKAEYDFEDDSFNTVSQNARDFISALLVKRKEDRLSAEQCLKHIWLDPSSHQETVILSTDKLKKFIIRRKWQKTGNAIRALGRMATLSASRRNSANSTPNTPRTSLVGSLVPKMASLNEEISVDTFVNADECTFEEEVEPILPSIIELSQISKSEDISPKIIKDIRDEVENPKAIRTRACSERSDSGISDCSSHLTSNSCSSTPLLGKKMSISEDPEYQKVEHDDDTQTLKGNNFKCSIVNLNIDKKKSTVKDSEILGKISEDDFENNSSSVNRNEDGGNKLNLNTTLANKSEYLCKPLIKCTRSPDAKSGLKRLPIYTSRTVAGTIKKFDTHHDEGPPSPNNSTKCNLPPKLHNIPKSPILSRPKSPRTSSSLSHRNMPETKSEKPENDPMLSAKPTFRCRSPSPSLLRKTQAVILKEQANEFYVSKHVLKSSESTLHAKFPKSPVSTRKTKPKSESFQKAAAFWNSPKT